MSETRRCNWTLPGELVARIEKIAATERRGVSAQVAVMLEEWIDEHRPIYANQAEEEVGVN